MLRQRGKQTLVPLLPSCRTFTVLEGSAYHEAGTYPSPVQPAPKHAAPSLRLILPPPVARRYPPVLPEPPRAKKTRSTLSERQRAASNVRRRLPSNSTQLITLALESAPQKRLTTREIYAAIHRQNPSAFPLEEPDSRSWKNTVRYNLSTNPKFVRVSPRDGAPVSRAGTAAASCTGHSCWTVWNGAMPKPALPGPRAQRLTPLSVPQLQDAGDSKDGSCGGAGSPVGRMAIACLIHPTP